MGNPQEPEGEGSPSLSGVLLADFSLNAGLGCFF